MFIVDICAGSMIKRENISVDLRINMEFKEAHIALSNREDEKVTFYLQRLMSQDEVPPYIKAESFLTYGTFLDLTKVATEEVITISNFIKK